MHKGMRAEPQDKELKPKCIFFCKRLYGSNERQPESENSWFRGGRFLITGNKEAESDGLKLKMRIRTLKSYNSYSKRAFLQNFLLSTAKNP